MRVMLITHWCFSCCWAVLTLSQGVFSFSYWPASKEAGWAPEAGRGHSRDSWPQLIKGTPHTTWCHIKHINQGKLTRGRWPVLQDWPGISQQVVSNCTVHHSYIVLSLLLLLFSIPFLPLVWVLFCFSPSPEEATFNTILECYPYNAVSVLWRQDLVPIPRNQNAAHPWHLCRFFFFPKIYLFGKYKQVIRFQYVIYFPALATPVTKEQYCHMSPIPPLLTNPEQEKKKKSSLQDSFTAVQDAHQKTTDVL